MYAVVTEFDEHGFYGGSATGCMRLKTTLDTNDRQIFPEHRGIHDHILALLVNVSKIWQQRSGLSSWD